MWFRARARRRFALGMASVPAARVVRNEGHASGAPVSGTRTSCRCFLTVCLLRGTWPEELEHIPLWRLTTGIECIFACYQGGAGVSRG
jgi:hypothetical protein